MNLYFSTPAGTTPNGRALYPLIFYFREAASNWAGVLQRLPIGMQNFFVRLYLSKEEASPLAIELVRKLFDADIVGNALYMARTELKELLDLDIGLCHRLQDRLTWYFGERDGWVTPHHAADIADACPRSQIYHCKLVGVKRKMR